MSISSIPLNRLTIPTIQPTVETRSQSQSRQNSEPSVDLSEQAKQLLSSSQSQLNKLQEDKKANEEEGNESIQVSSSIGRTKRVSGLQRDEVAELYRTIEKLS
ncbi:hypothetical protein [Marinomonas sp. THO17]|uniref:hypothetical protein n=1 Tax=Marinomonas sp. THO17 TaxID=3149048 RepID=UPI00336BC709